MRGNTKPNSYWRKTMKLCQSKGMMSKRQGIEYKSIADFSEVKRMRQIKP